MNLVGQQRQAAIVQAWSSSTASRPPAIQSRKPPALVRRPRSHACLCFERAAHPDRRRQGSCRLAQTNVRGKRAMSDSRNGM